jgi:predicted Zn-dependent peptidase
LEAAKQNFGPNNLSMAIAGSLVPEEIADTVNSTFGRLEKLGLQKPIFSQPKRILHEETEEREDIKAAYVTVVIPVAGYESADFIPLTFISYILGKPGYLFSGRLFQEIRAKRDLAYAANSSYTGFNGFGLFGLAASIKLIDTSKIREVANRYFDGQYIIGEISPKG